MRQLFLPGRRHVRCEPVGFFRWSTRLGAAGCLSLLLDIASCARPWLRIPPVRVSRVENRCKFEAWKRIVRGRGPVRIEWLRTLLHCSMRGSPAGWLVPVVHPLGIIVEVLLRIPMIERLRQLIKSTIPSCVVSLLEPVVGGILLQSQPLPALSWTISVSI